MNNFSSWLKQENILLNLAAESELEAIRIMLDLAAQNPAVINPKLLAQSVFDTEIFRGSHRGCCGITFPALTNAVTEPLTLLGRFEDGIGYYSQKNKPIDLVVLIVAPHIFERQFERMLSKVKDLLCDFEFMANMRSIENPGEIGKSFAIHLRSRQNESTFFKKNVKD